MLGMYWWAASLLSPLLSSDVTTEDLRKSDSTQLKVWSSSFVANFIKYFRHCAVCRYVRGDKPFGNKSRLDWDIWRPINPRPY